MSRAHAAVPAREPTRVSLVTFVAVRQQRVVPLLFSERESELGGLFGHTGLGRNWGDARR
jgi:hypothetical protein